MSLPRSSPGTQRASAAGIRALFAELDARLDSVHGVVVVRHGHVVAEAGWQPYGVDAPHAMYSVSKSFTSMAIGFAVADGLLSVDDRLIELFPDAAPADPDPRLAALRVRHLLTMTTGHAADSMDALFAAADGDWVAAFLALPLEAEPGTLFVYDTGASFVLSALVQQLTGQRVLEYLTPRLLEPLDITSARWQQNAHGVDFGGFGLSITTRELAAFGEFLLRRGRVGDRQLLPAAWIDTAASALVPSAGVTPDWQQGYGYQLWRSRHGYRGDGAFGQFCLVLPEQDAVIAITGSLPDMQLPLDIVWAALETVFPATASVDETPGDPELARFEVPSPQGAPRRAHPGARFRLERTSDADTLSIRTRPDGTELVIGVAGREHRILFGADRWVGGTTDLAPEPGARIAARGAWLDDTVFRGRIVGADDPHGVDHEVRITGDRVEWSCTELVSFGPVETRTAVGRRA